MITFLKTIHWHITFGDMKIFYWHFVKWKVPVAIYSYFNRCEKVVKVLVTQSHLTVTPWIITWPAPLSMKFFRQEYWRGSPSSILRDWTQVFCIAGRLFTIWATREDPKTFDYFSYYLDCVLTIYSSFPYCIGLKFLYIFICA